MKKKMLLVCCIFGFFSIVLAQKTWFLSFETAPAIKFQNEQIYQNWSTINGPNRKDLTLGAGIRLFRSSSRRLQPEVGMEIRGIRPEKIIVNAQDLFVERTIRQFSMAMDVGYRLESRPFSSGWRVSFGASIALWLPFLSSKQNFDDSKYWGNFYDDPQIGLGCSLNFGRQLDSGRRLDYGFQIQKFELGYYSLGGNSAFRLMKMRASISIDQVQKK